MTEEAELLLLLARAWFARYGRAGFCPSGAARDDEGNLCDPCASDARSFSMTGALDRALFEQAISSPYRFVQVTPAPGAIGRAYVIEACRYVVPRVEDWELVCIVDGMAKDYAPAQLLAWIDDAVARGRSARGVAEEEGSVRARFQREVDACWTLDDLPKHVAAVRERVKRARAASGRAA